MSESGKSIKFSFAIDQQSAQSVMKTLKDLTDQAEKFAKALQSAAGAMSGGGSFFGGANVGGKAPGPSSSITKAAGAKGGSGGGSVITNVVMENAKAFKNMTSMSGDALKSMQDILKTSVEQQKKSISELDKTIDGLGKRYQQLKKDQEAAVASAQKLGIDPKVVKASYADKMSGVGDSIVSARKDRMDAAEKMSKFSQETGQPHTGMFGQMKGAYQQGGIGGLMTTPINIPGMGMALRMGGLAAGGLIAAGTEMREGTRAFNSAEADRGRLVNPRIRALRGGDTTDLAVLREISKDGALKKDLQEQYKGKGAEGEALFSGVMDVFSKVAGSISGGVIGSKGMTLQGLTDMGIEQHKAESFIKFIDEAKQKTSFLDRQMFEEEELASFGSRASLAHGGGPKRTIDKNGKVTDNYLREQSRLAGGGFSAEQAHSYRMQMLGSAGEEGRGYGEAAMRAAAGGYGAYGGLVAQSIRLGQKDNLAQMAIGGGIDKTAGMQLGAGIMQMNPFGLTNDAGTFAALQASGAFTGKGFDFTTSNRVMAGLQEGNRVTQGATGYQRSSNLLSAIDILGKNSSIQARDYLATGIDHKDMVNMAMTGQMSDKAKALGITQEHVKKQLESSFNSASNLALGGSGSDPMSMAIKNQRQSGMSPTDRLKFLMASGNKEEARNLQLAMADAAGMKEGADTGYAIVNEGVMKGGTAKKGRVGAGKLDFAAQAEADRQAKELLEQAKRSEEYSKDRAADAGFTQQLAKAFHGLGTGGIQNMEVFGEKMGVLAEAADKAAMNLSKLMSPADRAKFLSTSVTSDKNATTKPNDTKAGGVKK